MQSLFQTLSFQFKLCAFWLRQDVSVFPQIKTSEKKWVKVGAEEASWLSQTDQNTSYNVLNQKIEWQTKWYNIFW